MLQQELLKWYGLNQRQLPWRNTTDPYVIWLSEVILQQTRVQQGLPYFLDFLQTYPQVKDMAQASEDEILKHWQGLGYYSRARNMHHTAKLVNEQFKGSFPKSYAELIKLKGIGPYTAAAIASFAYNEAVAVLDGNVFRVLSRLYGQAESINSTTGKKIFAELAQTFLNKKNPAMHNQAMMELGSLVCTPTKPNCPNCPLESKCLAHQLKQEDLFPVKNKKNPVRHRYFSYLHLQAGSKLAIIKRPAGDIWQNLVDLPLLESSNPLSLQEFFVEMLELNWIHAQQSLKLVYEKKHILSHQHLHANFYFLEIPKPIPLGIGEIWVTKKELLTFGVPRLFQHYLESLE
ncbi:MAG: A/G-specific adenine glycosylase [Bacteroidetes bacterium B1(2017)]|nr:MAG: A/G-specific adenine glycosylase [Bacteroidetes bacterium B1(2017)]